MPTHRSRHFLLICSLAAAAFLGDRAAAQDETSFDPFVVSPNGWEATVHEAQETQPSWITPLATTTPRLEEEFRYDQDRESLKKGRIDIYGGGKGLELIPTTRTEVLITVPPYQVRTGSEPSSGFNDWPGILVKYRIIARNAKTGDYVVSVFFQYGLPTGALDLTNHNHVFTPTLAAGKGFGDFDLQGTIGEAIPTHDNSSAGRSVLTNLTAQYHVGNILWPEVEMNRTDWIGGARGARTQTFLTFGVIFGRFVVSKTNKVIVGAGYQTAVSRVYGPGPMTPTYNHNWVVSARLTF